MTPDQVLGFYFAVGGIVAVVTSTVSITRAVTRGMLDNDGAAMLGLVLLSLLASVAWPVFALAALVYAAHQLGGEV